MLKFFPVRDQNSAADRQQSRLMIAVGLMVIALAAMLTIAPAVRYHGGSERYQFRHWLGVLGWFLSFTLLHWQSVRVLPRRDPFLLPIIGALTGLGLMMIWRLYPNLGLRQTVWLILGSGVMLLGMQFPAFLRQLRRYKYIWLVIGVLLTALTITFGQNPSGEGPALWLNVFGIYFQPSEPLKLLLIVYLAGYFTDRVTFKHKTLATIFPTLIVAGLALGLLVSQKDLGTALIFLAIYLLMLYAINGSGWVIWVGPLALFAAGVFGYFLIDIVHLRLSTWLNPLSDPSGASYQVLQSMIAIAEGGLLGAGLGLGSPNLIPVSVSDFIYAAIGEELGLFGLLAIVALIALLVYRAMRIALHAKEPFHRFLATGIAYYFGFQSILIIGGNIGLLPLTGVTLPFVSYGGSSLLVSFIALGILLTISQAAPENNPKPQHPRPRLFWSSIAIVAILVLEFVVSSLQGFWIMPRLVDRPENTRWAIADRFVPRGDILDRNTQIIITSEGTTGELSRVNKVIPLSPILGYTDPVYGQTGIEAAMYEYLRGLEGYTGFDPEVRDLLYNQPMAGLDVRLTLDLNLQSTADDLLGDRPGAVLLMNAASGEIMAMASHPYFDSNNLEGNWGTLLADENAPLVNRTTQGLYPAGSTLFPFILADQRNLLDTYPDPSGLLPDLSGSLDCALRPADTTWTELVRSGCLDAQKALAATIGQDALVSLYERMGFYSNPALRLPVAEVDPPLVNDPAAFFQGLESVSISPLQMVTAASALSNNGTRTAPRIVIGYQDPNGGWVTLPKLGENQTVLSNAGANQISTLLSVEGASFWQVSAAVTTADDEPVAWFIAGTTSDWQGQPYAVVVVLEEDAPREAAAIGTALLEQVIQFTSAD
ncbi:MAG: FtsW/RodA/SpoVE family cell cycle protein [Chloroflexota bacterium]|nr:FtsW/RodA/SpoVE family cell cycle protein [Chloroflexota bacterium]